MIFEFYFVRNSHVCIGYEKLFQLPLVYNLAKKYNEKYGETFHHPVPIINGNTPEPNISLLIFFYERNIIDC